MRKSLIQQIAIEVAAGGRHHALFHGPARNTAIRQVSDHLYASEDDPVGKPPVRWPHYSVSLAGLMGNVGRVNGCPRPGRRGEISLANGGILVIDDPARFEAYHLARVIEAVRQGEVRFLATSVDEPTLWTTIPAKVQLVLGMEAPPYPGDGYSHMPCESRIATWLIDELDLVVEITDAVEMPTDSIRNIAYAAAKQAKRFEGADGINWNGEIRGQTEFDEFCRLSRGAAAHLASLDISAAAMHHLLRVSLTIKDLAWSTYSDPINKSDIELAQRLRNLPLPGIPENE